MNFYRFKLLVKCLLGLNKPRTLSEWLERATLYLIPSAQNRIRSEIETHYGEAVASHLSNGESDAEAQSAALAELGSAKSANRRFRRKYLTVYDLNMTCRRICSVREPGWLGVHTLQLIVVWLIVFPSIDNILTICTLLFQSLLFIFCQAYLYNLTAQKTTPTLLRKFFFAHFIQFFLCQITQVIMAANGFAGPDDGITFSSLFLAVPVAHSLAWLDWILLRKKLLSASEEDFVPQSGSR